ncbi:MULTISPECIES: hypothetical protein [unclassified Sphingomonas]|uniref:hypothetical protein n=1 Tax=unclassified Sphingomonas TaxID=196159 RepID=UPI00257C9423|nr:MULTISPECIES: hypothetical protein [unclassified Sphingomonas]
MADQEGSLGGAAAQMEVAGALTAIAANDVTNQPGTVAEEVGSSVNERMLVLFSELNIAKVVLVDDRLDRPLDAALVTKAVGDNAEAQNAVASFFPDIDLSDANGSLYEQIDAILSRFDSNKRDDLAATLAQFDEEAADTIAQRLFDHLMPAEFPVEYLTPAKWETKRDELLAECSTSARTLFLFDQQLGTHGEGTAIISNLAQQDRTAFGAKWFCGLLSHTLDKGAEVSRWRELSEQKSLDLELFMPISKQNLSDGDAFYGAVYRTVVNVYAERMKNSALHAFETAFGQTLEKFKNLDPVDFEHVIANSSEGEGVSELDTLIRLYSIIQRDKVKTELLNQDRLAEFLDTARTVKRVADVGRGLSDDAQARLALLRAEELYEPGSLINQFRDPLRNGDIFEVGTGDSLKLWVLIGQPCDLMVRSSGERAYEDNFKVAVLAPINVGKDGRPPEVKHGLGFTLDRLAGGGRQMGFVEFTKATPVALDVLDLVVLRTDGACEIDTCAEAPSAAFSSVSWDNRATKMRTRFKRIAAKIEGGRGSGGDKRVKELATYLLPPAAPGAIIKRHGAYEKGRFSYGIKRVRRVREPFAASLLSAFSRFLSREAYDHDFSAERRSGS